MAPLLGPLIKEASWRVGSGMAMQSAAPPAGTATREMSNTESEGHCLSAASFVVSLQSTSATKTAALWELRAWHVQVIEIKQFRYDPFREETWRHGASIPREMQNPAYSVQSRGPETRHRRQASDFRRQASGS
jgi:hypothetical protein